MYIKFKDVMIHPIGGNPFLNPFHRYKSPSTRDTADVNKMNLLSVIFFKNLIHHLFWNHTSRKSSIRRFLILLNVVSAIADKAFSVKKA